MIEFEAQVQGQAQAIQQDKNNIWSVKLILMFFIFNFFMM